MQISGRLPTYLLLAALILSFPQSQALARVESGEADGAKRAAEKRDGQHDFDFVFGIWKAHIRLLLHPLTGSQTWTELEGVSTVRRVWGGRANLGELDVRNATTHLEGLSLRLYNPQSRHWSIYWSNSREASLGKPMIGQFSNGRGEFYNQENVRGCGGLRTLHLLRHYSGFVSD